MDNNIYMVYSREDLDNHVHTFSCGHSGEDIYEMPNSMAPEIDMGVETVQDGLLRKYRLALATTIEYTAYISQQAGVGNGRSEEHTSELQSRGHLVCRL